MRSGDPMAEIPGRYRSDASTNALIGFRQTNIGNKRPVASGQRADEAFAAKTIVTEAIMPESIVVKEAMSVAKKEVKANGIVAIETRAIPRKERISRSHREPAKGAVAKTGTVSKAKEEHKGRGPHWTV